MPTLLMLGFWDTLWGINMMSLCNGWGWQPPQIASCIHIRHIQSVWAQWIAIHGHTAVASNSYSQLLGSDFGGLCKMGFQHAVIMSCLRLTPPQTASHILIRHKEGVWAHWYALHMRIGRQPQTVKPAWLGSDVGVLGHFWGVNMMSLCNGWGW